MRIGFTGTREGMTIDQWATFEIQVRAAFRRVTDTLDDQGSLPIEVPIDSLLPHEWHDGDCIGADTQAHGSVAQMKSYGLPVVLHGWPCNLDKYRAQNEYDVLHDVMPPLVRNRDIVNNSDLMFAAPIEYEEIFKGSGTWATIRYARRQDKPLIIVWPDGSMTGERV